MPGAKKRFGQHFLVDPRKAGKIVDSLEIKPGDAVLEIGPGTGILTERILAHDVALTAVELDREMIAPLMARFGGHKNLTIVNQDIIKLNPRDFAPPAGLKILGNLPYNISGAIMEWFIEYNDVIRRAVVTVQKEVADRIRATSPGRDYGSLTVMIQSYFDIKKLFDIPPGCFSPPPKVYSTVLLLTSDRKFPDDMVYSDFRDFLRACFSHKRKLLVNSLSAVGAQGNSLSKGQLEKYLARLGKKANIRAEELKLDEFLELFRLVRGQDER